MRISEATGGPTVVKSVVRVGVKAGGTGVKSVGRGGVKAGGTGARIGGPIGVKSVGRGGVKDGGNVAKIGGPTGVRSVGRVGVKISGHRAVRRLTAVGAGVMRGNRGDIGEARKNTAPGPNAATALHVVNVPHMVTALHAAIVPNAATVLFAATVRHTENALSGIIAQNEATGPPDALRGTVRIVRRRAALLEPSEGTTVKTTAEPTAADQKTGN